MSIRKGFYINDHCYCMNPKLGESMRAGEEAIGCSSTSEDDCCCCVPCSHCCRLEERDFKENLGKLILGKGRHGRDVPGRGLQAKELAGKNVLERELTNMKERDLQERSIPRKDGQDRNLPDKELQGRKSGRVDGIDQGDKFINHTYAYRLQIDQGIPKDKSLFSSASSSASDVDPVYKRKLKEVAGLIDPENPTYFKTFLEEICRTITKYRKNRKEARAKEEIVDSYSHSGKGRPGEYTSRSGKTRRGDNSNKPGMSTSDENLQSKGLSRRRRDMGVKYEDAGPYSLDKSIHNLDYDNASGSLCPRCYSCCNQCEDCVKTRSHIKMSSTVMPYLSSADIYRTFKHPDRCFQTRCGTENCTCSCCRCPSCYDESHVKRGGKDECIYRCADDVIRRYFRRNINRSSDKEDYKSKTRKSKSKPKKATKSSKRSSKKKSSRHYAGQASFNGHIQRGHLLPRSPRKLEDSLKSHRKLLIPPRARRLFHERKLVPPSLGDSDSPLSDLSKSDSVLSREDFG